MSQIILEMSNTTVLNDSMVGKLTVSADTCLLNLNKTATNCCNANIAKYVSLTIIMVAAICAVCYLIAKLIANNHASRFDKRKREWDKEDKLNKQKSEAWAMKLQWLKENKKSDYVSEINKYIFEIEESQNSNDQEKQN